VPNRVTAHVVFAACAVVFWASACSPAADSPIADLILRIDSTAPNHGAAEVSYLDLEALDRLQRSRPTLEEWQEILAVYAGGEEPAPDATAVLGTYSISGDTLRFTPRFPPMTTQSYVARYDGAALLKRVGGRVRNERKTVVITGWSSAAPGDTRVVHVYPTSDRLPANLLKLYVLFSAPMRTGEAAARIRLIDDSGGEVDDAFLNVPQELWDPDKRRLTVLFDPGRIKSDLRPHEELGLPLQEGRAYTLTIDSEWRDANGATLASAFEKRFTVIAADRVSPAPSEWRIAAPARNTRDYLTLDFPEPLDYALLRRVIIVKRSSGEPIAGSIVIARDDRQWLFSPAQPWAAGAYILEIGAELEDLAGNNLTHVFDRPHAPGDRTSPPKHVELRFNVR